MNQTAIMQDWPIESRAIPANNLRRVVIDDFKELPN